jgi:hypothetical protein
MSFLRHGEIYRSDEVCSTGSKRSGSLPVLIGVDEFQPAIPWQDALQQSLPPLRRPRAILQNQTSPYNDFSANGDNPLYSVSQPKGALQIESRGRDRGRVRRRERHNGHGDEAGVSDSRYGAR